MEDAGWIKLLDKRLTPDQLADICLRADYQGPFDLIFYCYYAFPTDYPEDIRKIFGKEYFNQVIEAEAADEVRKTIQATSVEAVVVFNKGVFNLVSKDRIERYVERIIGGELIHSQINGIDQTIPVYLTFPTGWRYHRQHRQLHKASLEAIKAAICTESNVPNEKDKI